MATDYTIQSTYGLRRDEFLLGTIIEAFGPMRVRPATASGKVQAGFGVFKVPTMGNVGYADPYHMGNVFHLFNPPAAVNTTAILASGGVSSASVQNVNGAALNGTYATIDMEPARFVTLILNSNAAWLATTAVLTGYDMFDRLVSENLAIPAGGNTTLTSVNRFKRVTNLMIPVQTGAGGTYTIGIAAQAAITAADFAGVAVRNRIKESYSVRNIYNPPGVLVNGVEANYFTGEELALVEMGAITVYSEVAVKDGDPVYVRIASGGGGSTAGAFRIDADTATAVQITNARFCRNSSAAGPAWARFSLL